MCRPPSFGVQLPRLALTAVLLAVLAPPSDAQEVTLPLERYEKLREQAKPATEPEPPAPVAFERAFLTVTVSETADSANARIVQDLTVTVLDEGWQSLAVGDAGSVIGADFGTVDGRLETGSNSGTKVVLRGAGRHRLRLTSVVPLERDEAATRPSWRLAWTVPRAAVVEGVVEAARSILEIEAQGAIVTVAGDGRWTLVAEPGAAVTLDLHGAAAVPERRNLPLAFEAVSGLALEVGRTRRRGTGWLDVRVRQGELDRLTLPIPEGFEVIDLGGDAVAGWDVDDQQLSIIPLKTVVDQLNLEIALAAGPASEFAGAVLVPDGAVSVVAAAKIRVSGDGLLELLDAGSARRSDRREQAELPAAFVAAPGMALVLPTAGSPARWRVSWAESTEVLAAQVDRLLVDVVIGDNGLAAYQLWAEVRNRGGQQLAFELPAGAELFDALRDGRHLEPGLDSVTVGGPAVDAWVVPLAAGERPQVIYVACLVPLALPATGRLEVPLPALSAPIGRMEVSVSLPGGARYELADGARAGATGAPPVPRRPGASGPLFGIVDQASVALTVEDLPELFPRPPGFRRLTAGWSALSASPAPLEIRIVDQRDGRRWF